MGFPLSKSISPMKNYEPLLSKDLEDARHVPQWTDLPGDVAW
jgi:hypothetical protein